MIHTQIICFPDCLYYWTMSPEQKLTPFCLCIFSLCMVAIAKQALNKYLLNG